MRKNQLLATVLFCLLCLNSSASQKDSLLLMFWNVENFFDWKDDSLSISPSDAQFSSFGSRHWTKKKFHSKCNAIAKSILWIKDTKGKLPDILGLAEVENRFVLEQLLKETPLRKSGFSIVHFESPDPRGIDVALLYRRDRLELLRASPLKIKSTPPLLTRDILLAEFLTISGDSLAFLVNHHPSKYGNASQWKREAALRTLRSATDSLYRIGFSRIVATGDFNDTPENRAFEILTESRSSEYALVDLASPLAARGEGSIRYSGKWELIDLFYISQSLAAEVQNPRMEVIRIPFLMTWDNVHSGEKPLRTFSGPRHIGGVSDHCPVVFEIK